jgi:hypothetical protein
MIERVSKRLGLKPTPIEANIELSIAKSGGPVEEAQFDEAPPRLVLCVHADDIEKIKQYAIAFAKSRTP